MAKGDPVGPEKEIVRYAKPSEVPTGFLTSAAFQRRRVADDDGLSINRLGVFSLDLEEDLGAIRKVMTDAGFELKKNGRFARILVADVLAAGFEANEATSVIEDPIEKSDKGPANPAHALILGMPFKDAENGGFVGMVAADILARKVDAAHLHDAVKTLTPSTR